MTNETKPENSTYTINTLKIAILCDEIISAAKRKETRTGATIMCAEIARKIKDEITVKELP